MNTNLLINKLSSKHNGTWFRMSWCTDVPITANAKKAGVTVLKYTTATVRKGIKYSNIASVKEKVAAGKIDPKHELSWGQWKAGYAGLLIEHTNKQGIYKEYVRLYGSPNKSNVQYFYNGRPITKEQLKDLGVVQASYWNKSSEPSECFTVCTANVQDIW